MKLFLPSHYRKHRQGGFSLVEATFSIGLLSFGFLTLGPLLALGLKTARSARNESITAQIAQTLVEEAKQGTLPTGTVYLDIQGTPLTSGQAAAYSAQSIFQTVTGNNSLTRLTLQITPAGAPDRMRDYAVVFQTPPLPAP